MIRANRDSKRNNTLPVPQIKKLEDYKEDLFDVTKVVENSVDICAFCKEGYEFGLMLKRLTPIAIDVDTDDLELDHGASVNEDIMDVDRVWAARFSLGTSKRRLFAHFVCAITAPRVWFTGVKWLNLRCEITRGNALTCYKCDKRGATVGCNDPKCNVVMHFHCAVSSGFRSGRYNQCFLCQEHTKQLHNLDGRIDKNDNDLSQGREPIRVEYENKLDKETPLQGFRYVSANLDSDEVTTNARNIHDLPCCTCEDLCDDVNTCVCLANGKNYNYKGELVPYWQPRRVIECNIRCHCSIRRCTNRVVQQGLHCRLQVYRTKEHRATKGDEIDGPPKKAALIGGWAVKALDSIEINAFVCEMVGQFVINKEDGPGLHAVHKWRKKKEKSMNLVQVDLMEREEYHTNSSSVSDIFNGPLCVDSRRFGNVSAFIRDSRYYTGLKPNLVKVQIYDRLEGGFPRLALFALKAIEPDEDRTAYPRCNKHDLYIMCGQVQIPKTLKHETATRRHSPFLFSCCYTICLLIDLNLRSSDSIQSYKMNLDDASCVGPHGTEDVSTLGVDWGEADSITQATADNSAVILDSQLEEQARYYEKNAYIVDGFKCPNEFITVLTPMEFEEMVNLFVKFDGNRSGTIDKHETKKILHFLGLDFSIEKAEELLKIVDADGSGEIDFEEFCAFIVLIKKGDERLKGFGSLLEKINSTPLGELERQARYREMKVEFEIVEEREATLFNPTLYVVEVHLTGMWHKVEGGEIHTQYMVRKFQGMGQNTKEAKYAAATSALMNLGDAMPGIKFKPGDFPEDWLQWVDDNLQRGVEPGKIVSILASKGFHPHKNIGLMHRILAWQSLLKFHETHPEVDIHDVSQRLHDDFIEWVKQTALKGIDGEIIYQLLKDKFIDLEKENIFLSQKLRNNELGSLIAKDEKRAYLLDFWHACKCGYLDDVIIYCKCGVPINEETLDRYTCERTRALAYAATNGHAEVIRVLLEYKADINHLDKRGRNAVHLAAMRGHVKACEVLIQHGGRLFAGDMHGNTPLHLAALNEHYDAIDFLAGQGQEMTRLITSDKVRAKKGCTFQDLVTEVFEKLPGVKLGPAETVRFEKKWLHDAAVMLVKLMDDDVKYMLPRSCEEIMEDVLARFDPRPETGVFVTDDVKGDQIFIKTVSNPKELTVLLKYTYRQAAIDSINNFHRTALHMACDANKVNSHEKIILRLIDTYGCNVTLRDMHQRRAIDLLIQDKVIRDMPSATEAREKLLISRRESDLNAIFAGFDAIDRKRTEDRRQAILDECIIRGSELIEKLWHCLRDASVFRKKFGMYWEMYEDPDTGNYFFAKAPEKRLMGDKHSNYSWTEPKEAKSLIDYTFALDYLRRAVSKLLRTFNDWEVYRCNKTQIEFYYQVSTGTLRFTPPAEMDWSVVVQEASRKGERLGYAKEWEVLIDKYNNVFYRNRLTRECVYERPIDAIVMTPAEMLCTLYQSKGVTGLEQKWFSCEQCNRAWKTNAAEMLMQKSGTDGGGTGSAVTKSLIVCEPCIARCHSNHKGVRFLFNAPSTRSVNCMCMEVSKVTQLMCRACNISETQVKTQELAANYRDEMKRHRQRNKDYPPIFAFVPRLDRRNQIKTVSGWHICRMCSSQRSRVMVQEKEEDARGDSLVIDSVNDDSTDSSTDSDGQEEPEEGSSKKDMKDAAQEIAKIKDVQHDLHGTQGAWVEVFDVEESEVLRHGDIVLCTRYSGIPKRMGRVKSVVKAGFYKIRFDDKDVPEEVLERSYIELVSRPKFYFHTGNKISAWSKDDLDKAYESTSMTISGEQWMRLFQGSSMRRGFEEWDEMQSPLLDQVFYCHHEVYLQEKASIRLQTIYRQKFRRPRPVMEWRSQAFTFDPPQKVEFLKRIKAGWAYLHRRSTNVGEFLDKEGDEWEEYTDNKTAEFFYWMEEDNQYQWDKPLLYVRNTNPESAYKEGEDVMFRFPGRRNEEPAVITKVRYDDETGEDMYDLVHKYVPEMAFKWIPRLQIKHVPMEGDALMLAKMEVKWKHQIRRRREADERKSQRERELRIQRELEQLEEMKKFANKMQFQDGSDAIAVSSTTRLMRGRLERITLEAQIVREEIDEMQGKARREKIYAYVADLKQQFGARLSRAEELNMIRSLELKYMMEDRILKRDKMQKELVERKKEAQERIVYVETSLRDKEVVMTTPRSLRRRKIIRRTHIGMKRQADGLMICEWGCGDWFRIGHEQQDHQLYRCVKRIMPCALGCTVKHTEEHWLSPHQSSQHSQNVDGEPSTTSDNTLDKREDAILGTVTVQQYHETEECLKRLVICPLQCMQWINYEDLDKHVNELCVKRPAKPLECRLGCGALFGGSVEDLIQAEDERTQHEGNECDLRVVRCNWLYDDGKVCAAQMRACDRSEHRDFHLTALGITTYTVPGSYIYRIPKGLTKLKVQVWGAGGGSGYFLGRQGGDGGGGAFIEAILNVEPFSVLEITVGSGGVGGVAGTEVEAMDLSLQRALAAERRAKVLSLPPGTKIEQEANQMAVTQGQCGVAEGGQPGGGIGYGGGVAWASGGGGGYSSICRRAAKGKQVYLVAAGGGGGASQCGRPAAGLEGELPGTRLDPLNGSTATPYGPGKAGESGSTFNAAWAATSGEMWQGGNGCEFGGGGGGGYYGGGGGGTSPGISGGGGGGASFVNFDIVRDFVVICGHGMDAGGKNHEPPLACGVGEWDKVGGYAGQGGRGFTNVTFSGNNGAVRLLKPGHY